uniref:G_PROTEIN_RECEP_F1_2 domain-containing protein n=1 Tax=Steinernema glaseri TaxID=37863 RepID=A0A1I7YA74_9BILA
MDDRNIDGYFCGCVSLKTLLFIIAVATVITGCLNLLFISEKAFNRKDRTPWQILTIDAAVTWASLLSCGFAILSLATNESGFLFPLLVVQAVQPFYVVVKILFFDEKLLIIARLVTGRTALSAAETHVYLATASLVYVTVSLVLFYLTRKCYMFVRQANYGHCAERHELNYPVANLIKYFTVVN